MAEKLYIRHATAADEQKIFDFYKAHSHKFVAHRDPDVWRERIKSGAVTIVENAKGDIVASGISYPLFDKDANGNDVHRWTEIGSSRVVLDGLGLFHAVLCTQVIRDYFLEPPEDRFVVEIHPANKASQKVLLREGAVLFNPPPEMTAPLKKTLAPQSQNMVVDWYQLGIEHMPHFAKSLLALVQNPVLKHPRTGIEYELDFSKCITVQQFLADVKKLAAQNTGDPKKPDPALKIHPKP